ncbi:hypothetical protein [Streptomyces decoyicus]|uniref:hypothetical protein n=1 Tax=Streptomyces decoyicus TaxID=249567 RepID=UPI00386E0DE9
MAVAEVVLVRGLLWSDGSSRSEVSPFPYDAGSRVTAEPRGAMVTPVASGHSSPLSHAEEVADLITRAAVSTA